MLYLSPNDTVRLFLSVNYSNCIQHELTTSDHLDDSPFFFLASLATQLFTFCGCHKTLKTSCACTQIHNYIRLAMTNRATKWSEQNEENTRKNRDSFVQDARELATHFISFLFQTWNNSVSFAVFISFSGGFCFCRSVSVYFMCINIKYLGKIKRKMRHCWTKEQQNSPVSLPKICVQRCFFPSLFLLALAKCFAAFFHTESFYCVPSKQANSLVLHETVRVCEAEMLFQKDFVPDAFFTFRMIRMNTEHVIVC